MLSIKILRTFFYMHYLFRNILLLITLLTSIALPMQGNIYLPNGELWHHSLSTPDRYMFTGKERDWETGYDYFSIGKKHVDKHVIT